MSQRSHFFVDPRLVILAVGVAAGSPGAAIASRIGLPERLAWGAVGVLGWWYLYGCVAQVRPRRGSAEQVRGAAAIRWRRAAGAVVLAGVFYASAGLLGAAWRSCPSVEPSVAFVHVTASSLVAAIVVLVGWNVTTNSEGVARVLVAFAVVAVAGVLLAWPSMVVWQLVLGFADTGCDTPAWWPSWLPI